MKRTTVKIPDDLDRRLRQEAERLGLSMSEITRQALEARLGTRRPILMSMVGSSSSGRTDLAARSEEIVAELIRERFEEERRSS
jgi:Ribbon-helix-helix protein, copG family